MYVTNKKGLIESFVIHVSMKEADRSETCNSWTSYFIIEEISTISNTLGAPCMLVDTDQQSSVIIT